MNSPVVAIADLPVGPARAAVALSRGGKAPFEVTVAVRCERTGQVAFFTAGGELQELRSTSIAIDAALSFAESMGFLFDDEEVEIHGADGPRVAAKVWQRFLHGDAEGKDLSDPPEQAETALDVEDELGPILSAIAPDLDVAAHREPRRTPPGPPREPDELPFWLAIPDAEMPRQSARPAAPDSKPRAPRPADDLDTDSPAPAQGGPSEGEKGLEHRVLLMKVLAETAVDRVCASHAARGPGLSKFRLKPSERDPQGISHSIPSRDELHRESLEVLDFQATQDDTNSPPMARYPESTRRPHLLLRLLSRF